MQRGRATAGRGPGGGTPGRQGSLPDRKEAGSQGSHDTSGQATTGDRPSSPVTPRWPSPLFGQVPRPRLQLPEAEGGCRLAEAHSGAGGKVPGVCVRQDPSPPPTDGRGDAHL